MSIAQAGLLRKAWHSVVDSSDGKGLTQGLVLKAVLCVTTPCPTTFTFAAHIELKRACTPIEHCRGNKSRKVWSQAMPQI